MRRIFHPIVLIILFFVGMIQACSLPTITIEWPKTETITPASTASPTETSTVLPTPTGTFTPVPATETHAPIATRASTLIRATLTPQFAPFCESEPASQSQCQFPIAEQSSTFCENKSPYNLIALNDGARYKVLHEYIQCSEAGTIDGQRLITCTGPMAYYFELQVCDSACSRLSIVPEDPHCPQGYNYNSLERCCTNEPQQVDQGCTVLKLRTTSCVTDCGQYTNRTTCTGYGYACRWDEVNAVCSLRR